MSNTNSHQGAAGSQHQLNAGHDQSDFNWTLILWTLPVAVVILVGFTWICLFFFLGYQEDENRAKQALFVATDLNSLQLMESEIHSQYKVLDKDLGRVQIPIERAMERLVAELQGSKGRAWAPITDVYVEGAAFGRTESKNALPPANTILDQEVPEASEVKKPEPKIEHGH